MGFNENETVRALKLRVQEQEGIKENFFRLERNYQEYLDEDALIVNYKIKSGSHLFMKLPKDGFFGQPEDRPPST